MSKKSTPEEFFQSESSENKVIVSSFERRADHFAKQKAFVSFVYHPASNIDPTQYLALSRLTPEELAQLESSIQTTQRGFL